MNELRIAEDFELPLDAVTRRMAILAMSGAGKSNAAVRLAESMYDAGIPWVCIDPKGDWWGIRSNANGDGPGLPIPIFGGLHGDVPLEHTAGKLIGELIVEQRLTCVLDVSEFDTRQHMWGFLADLGETLLRLNRQPLHLFLEEADEYIPQRSGEKGNLSRCLGVWQRVVKRGRFRGLGSTQITQRSAALNKDTLYQAELLIAMRAAGKGDRDAVKGWVEYANASAEIIDSLPTLANGEAWVSSPAWLRRTERVTFDRRRTFDSGSTPVMLDADTPPATLAEIDLDALGARIQATREQAEANDPKRLKSEIARLTRELGQRQSITCDHETELDELRQQVAQVEANHRLVLMTLQSYRDKASAHADVMAAAADSIRDASHALVRAIDEPLGEAEAAIALRSRSRDLPPQRLGQAGGSVLRTFEVPHSTRDAAANRRAQAHPRAPTEGLNAYGRDLLAAAAARHPAPSTRSQLSLISGRSHRSSAFGPALRTVVAEGYLEEQNDGRFTLTHAGLDEVGDALPPTGSDAVNWWRSRLPKGEGVFFDALVDAYPARLTREELAERTGRSLTSSAFGPTLRDLEDRGLITQPERGTFQAAEELFEAVRT